MGLFDKKYCDICGEKIGLLGNRKLEDGNLCKDCAKKLSPWFSDRRSSTVAEIKEQLEYRERNKEDVLAIFMDCYLNVNHPLSISHMSFVQKDGGVDAEVTFLRHGRKTTLHAGGNGRKERTHAKNEQETAAGMVFFPAASKSREYHLRPYHIQRPLPGLYP